MNRHYRMSVALDVDDLLLECIPYAIKLANEKYKFNPPISIHEVNRWGKLGSRADVILNILIKLNSIKINLLLKGLKNL